MNDLTGKIFGKLKVLGFSHREGKRYYWNCVCECGKETKVNRDQLVAGKTKSCGCLKRSWLGDHTRTHGMTRTRLYKIYCKMKERCYNPNDIEYKRYGARGIEICDEWRLNATSFINWAKSNGYSDDLSIDRIDPNGNYSPDNCKWSNKIEQANNKRNNITLTFNGETHTLPEWARTLDVPYYLLANRYRRGYPIHQILYAGKFHKTIPR